MKNELTCENYKRRIGEHLRKARFGICMSQKKVCRELNINRSQLSALENGYYFPSLDVIVKLAEFYGVATGYFLQRDDVLPYQQKEPYDYSRTKKCIGKYIVYVRKSIGITVDELSFLANVTPITYYNLRSGRNFTIKTFLKLCNAMNIVGDDILAKCVTYDFAGGYNPETEKMEGWWPEDA